MKRSNILQRTGIIGSNPIIAVLTWDVPRPVRFDSDVRKRVITVEANKLEKHNPIQADGIEG